MQYHKIFILFIKLIKKSSQHKNKSFPYTQDYPLYTRNEI